MSATTAGVTAFRESYTASNPNNDQILLDFDSWEARQMRYALHWGFFESNVYRHLHAYARGYKAEYGLYKYIRSIYNPTARLCGFYRSHIFGGSLDLNAGDGKMIPSAIPITMEIDNPALRKAIAKGWRWSNWERRKNTLAIRGAVLGDYAIEIVDDVDRQKVYKRLLHPGKLKWVDRDDFGNVKGYCLEEMRPDPDGKQKDDVTYREDVTRSSDAVVYQTFKNDKPYAWDGNPAEEWSRPYGFVPLVLVQHNDVGLDWGFAAMHEGLPKIREVDDSASKLFDHIRKNVDPVWLFSGVQKPASTPQVTNTTDRTSASGYDSAAAQRRPETGREEAKALYGPVGSDAKALVANLDISSVGTEIERLLKELERDYPELGADKLSTASGDVSGKAIRIAREPIESRVHAVRVNYDAAEVASNQMLIAIGGYRYVEEGSQPGNYDVFAPFDLDSYASGALDHAVDANRPVFQPDPTDKIEIDTAFWQAANTAKDAGYPLELYLKRQGWSEQDIAEFTSARDKQDAKDQARFDAEMSAKQQQPQGIRKSVQRDSTGRIASVTEEKT